MGCNARKITNIYIYIQFIYSRKHKIIWTWENINHKIYYNIWSNLLFSHLRVLLNISRAVYILVLALCSLGWKNPLGYGAPLITLRFRQVSLITLWYIRWAFSELSYMCKGSDTLSSTWVHPQLFTEMLSRKFYRMKFKTFGRVDLHTGEILSTLTSLRDSNAVTYICDGAKYRNVAGICVSTSGGQTVSYINCILTLVLNT